MEKKKERKNTLINLEPDTAQTGNEEDPTHHHQTGVVGLARKNSKTESPHHDNVANLNQQYPSVLQWPYTPQSVIEHSSSMVLQNPINTHHTPGENQRNTLVFNQPPQKNQYHHQQKNIINPVQSQNTPFWLPRPEIHTAGATYQPFTHLGTIDSSLQPPIVTAASSSNDPVSAFCYQGGYSYPMGFPGHWDASSWWGQTQTQFPHPYPPFASGYNLFPAPPPVAEGLASGQLHQRGIIRPPETLSRKHQRLWEAQSAENVHLWATLNRVEAEMAAYRSRLIRLESELSSLRPQLDGTVEGSSMAAAKFSIQTSKKGRPKKHAMLASPDDSRPKSRGRKFVLTKVQAETKGLGSQKEDLNQLEDKTKACDTADSIEAPRYTEQTDGRISTISANTGSFELNGSNLRLSSDIQITATYQNQIQQENPGSQINGFGSKSSLEIKGSDKEDYQKTDFSVLSQNIKGVDACMGVTASNRGTGNVIHGWPSNDLSEDYGSTVLGVGVHGFYDNGNMIRKENKFISGWSFPDENASEEHEDDEGSEKDHDNVEMEEDDSSAVDQTSQTKAEFCLS